MRSVGAFLLRFVRCLMSAFAFCTVFQSSHPQVLLSLVLVALVGAICWPMLEKQYGTERTLYLSMLPIRYGLAHIVAIYGFAKIFGLQFWTPFVTLDTPLGHVSGFELAWRFFGYSPAYAYFIAIAQILGSVLLLSRRTVTFGAMLLIPIFVNIVLINIGFAIPVTFFASLYLLLALYLLTPDALRLYRLLLLNQPVESRPLPLLFTESGQRRLVSGIKAVVVSLIYLTTIQSMRAIRERVNHASALTGAWKIERNQSATSSLPWAKVYFERGDWGSFRDQDDSLQWFTVQVDEQKQSVRLYFYRDEEPAIIAHYDRSGDEMAMTGTWHEKPFAVRLNRFDVERRR